MDEKYCLKWNDFQTTISGSLSLLRKEEDFFDVTLVSDDQKQVKAHKVVLSACSTFFKNILKNNPHQHPLLYLGGISSKQLQLITDYIYHGEVQVHQSDIDSFLEIAQKLKVSGLNQDGKDEKRESLDDSPYNDYSEETIDISEEKSDSIVSKPRTENKNRPSQKEMKTASISDMHELEGQIAALIRHENGLYVCKACGKTAKGKINITRHVELHIDGISLPCHNCGKIFRSRNNLRVHLQKCNQAF